MPVTIKTFTPAQVDAVMRHVQDLGAVVLGPAAYGTLRSALAADGVTLPDVADPATAVVSYSRLAANRIRTMLPDAQISNVFSPVEAASTGELLAILARHPAFHGKTITFQEVS